MKKYIAVTFVLIFLGRQGAAQLLSEVGFGLGAAIYQGDLSPHWIGSYTKPGVSFQLTGQRNINSFIAIRVGYAHASISDNEDSYTGGVHQVRNFSFKASVNELSAQVLINPTFNNGWEEPGNLRPYFFAGAGVALLQVERDWSRFNYSFPYWQSWVLPGLAQDSLTNIPSSIFTFPVGAGLRYQIGENVALYAEATKRLVSTEYLDGFSKSANRNERDGFSSLIFGLSFRLGNAMGDRGRIDCPKDVW
ncbi:outer membrane beta-barrel protein [Flavisolibacter sp. BT320]|nr:outer membrane beta-barrel protein [Flavisolibacter longurius]